MLRFLSVCSGIEAASVAWNPLGWKAAAFAEIENFPSAVLAHHYHDVPNLGDMTRFEEWPDLGPIDLLCGGTPCQSFSIAGLRAGLDDPRGNLMLTFGAIAAKHRPRWLVWENVPGVLSSSGGRDFGSFLGLLGLIGYGFAYRILDAQYAGLAQRRKRVFVVGCLGDWRSAAAVLFERHSLQGDPAPSRQAGQAVAPSLTVGTGGSSGHRYTQAGMEGSLVVASLRASASSNGHGNSHGLRGDGSYNLIAYGGNNTAGPIDCAAGLNAKGGAGRMDFDSETFITHSLTGEGFDASEDGTGRGTPLVPVIAFSAKDHGADAMLDCSPTLRAGGHDKSHANAGVMPAIAFDTTQVTSKTNRSQPKAGDPCHPLAASAHPPAIAFDARQSDVIQYGDMSGPLDMNGHTVAVAFDVDPRRGQVSPVSPTLNSVGQTSYVSGVILGMQVRRLTPRECCRLQGFPDTYLDITYRGKPAADGNKYRALGNSWAVPVVNWIGRRIESVARHTSVLREAA